MRLRLLVLTAAMLVMAGCGLSDSDTSRTAAATSTQSTTAPVSEPTDSAATITTRSPRAVDAPPYSAPEQSTGPMNSDGLSLNTIPPDTPGGSAIKVITPCDSGTSTLSAYRDGAGVSMTETLSNVAHETWTGYPLVTPSIALERPYPEPLEPLVESDGKLTVTSTNLRSVADDVDYAWPQEVAIRTLTPTSGDPNCFGTVYLGSSVYAKMHNLSVQLHPRSRTIQVSSNAQLPRGTWRITIDVTSPTGTQQQTRPVQVRQPYEGGILNYEFATEVSGFTNLLNFTEVAITATNSARHRTTWLTMIRTP